MARLLNQNHEEFCLKVIELGDQGKAYRAATGSKGSDKTCKEYGSKWAAEPKVAARIDELRQQTADKITEKTAIDAAWVLKKAQAVYEAAIQKESLAIALKSLEIIGKHIDVQAFKEQVDHHHHMTADEARSVVAALLPKYADKLSGETLQ